MTRLGLTQRVEVDEAHGERRDCLDQAWTRLLEGWGYTPVPLATTVESPRSYLDQFDLDGLVLTSGNDLAHLDDAAYSVPERDEFETAALEWALGRKVPVLGVCRGLELLNHYFGGSLAPVEDHVDTTHAVSFDLDERMEFGQMKWPDQIQVNSYHDYGIPEDAVGDEVVPVGTASDKTVECLFHPEHPMVGIMWHPERETPSTDVDRQLFDAHFRNSTE